MSGGMRAAAVMGVGFCSFIFAIIKLVQLPLPLAIWGLEKSPAAKLVFFGFCAAWIAFLSALTVWFLLDYLLGRGSEPGALARAWDRLTVKSPEENLRHELRNFRFSLYVAIVFSAAYFLAVVLSEVAPEEWSAALERVCYILGFLMTISTSFFCASFFRLGNMKKKFSFINSQEAILILEKNYKESNWILKAILKTIFTSQLNGL